MTHNMANEDVMQGMYMERHNTLGLIYSSPPYQTLGVLQFDIATW
jgi:hypothetical protein